MRMKSKREDEFEDELEDEEIREKKKEMRRLKVERDLLKMQAETEKMRQELAKYQSQGVVASNPDSQAITLGTLVATLVKSGVKPEQAEEFFKKLSPEALATVSALTSNNPYLPVFMYLASQSKGQSPQTLTAKDVIELNKSVYDLAKDIAGKGKGESGVVDVLKELTGMFREIYTKQLLDKIDELKNSIGGRSSVWDEILEDDKKFQRFKELFGSGTTKPEIQLEIEKLRQQHELNLKRLDLEMLKLRNEILEGRRKYKMFSQALKKIGESIAEGIGEAAEEIGEETAYQRPSQPQPQTLKCPKCGADIPGVVPGAEVTCPNCKTIYRVKVKGE